MVSAVPSTVTWRSALKIVEFRCCGAGLEIPLLLQRGFGSSILCKQWADLARPGQVSVIHFRNTAFETLNTDLLNRFHVIDGIIGVQ